MGNQQREILTNNQLQVLLTGFFGDGHITTPKNSLSNSLYSTRSIYQDYLLFKKALLGDLAFDIGATLNKGFKERLIYQLSTKKDVRITELYRNDLETNLKLMDDLGLALWIYDDGSLHKAKNFYNINSHSYSEEVHRDLFEPFLRDNFNIIAKTTKEVKKDGRVFFYLRISRHEGSFEISNILRKYYVPVFDYKIWRSETIQEWSKLQVQLKSEGRVLTPFQFTREVNKRVKNLQDIVQP